MRTDNSGRSPWPIWLGGWAILLAVFGPDVLAAVLTKGSDGPLRISIAVVYCWDIAFLALIAPFGGFRRSRVFRSLVPFVGFAYIVDMAWHCGTGLAHLSQRIRLDRPDERTVTRWGRVSSV